MACVETHGVGLVQMSGLLDIHLFNKIGHGGDSPCGQKEIIMTNNEITAAIVGGFQPPVAPGGLSVAIVAGFRKEPGTPATPLLSAENAVLNVMADRADLERWRPWSERGQAMAAWGSAIRAGRVYPGTPNERRCFKALAQCY